MLAPDMTTAPSGSHWSPSAPWKFVPLRPLLVETGLHRSAADALETPSARTNAQAQTVRNRVRIVRGLLGFTTTSVSFQKRGRRGGWRPLLTSKVRRVKKARKGTFLPMAQ